jgi:hypothetical protein
MWFYLALATHGWEHDVAHAEHEPAQVSDLLDGLAAFTAHPGIRCHLSHLGDGRCENARQS